jgi:hypothetical protein
LGVFESVVMVDDIYRNRFDKIIDFRLSLTVLFDRISCQKIEAFLAQL